jgi:hypothetical protein
VENTDEECQLGQMCLPAKFNSGTSP